MIFGKRRSGAEPARAVDPQGALAPFRVANPDPTDWVEVPLEFPTADDANSYMWMRRVAKAYQSRFPAESTKLIGGFFMALDYDAHNRFAGHSGFWALLTARPVDYLPLLIDVQDAQPGWLEGRTQALLAGPDPTLERHPAGYRSQPAAQAASVAVDAAGLGRGVAVVRRDKSDVELPGAAEALEAERRLHHHDPQFWRDVVSVHWLFSAAGKDLAISTRSDDLELLHWGVPRAGDLVDAISTPGWPAATTALPSPVHALVVDAIAGARADEARLIERYGPPPGE